MKISDVKLTAEDLARIEASLNEKYGHLPAHNKATARAKMIRDEKFAIWEARDEAPFDHGEAPKGSLEDW